jgi:hypothetical protein
MAWQDEKVVTSWGKLILAQVSTHTIRGWQGTAGSKKETRQAADR